MTTQEFKERFKTADLSRVADTYMEKVLTFAEKRGLLENLQKKFGQMAFPTFFGKPCTTRVSKDFSPYSFYFETYVGDRLVLSGGLIYYGPGESGVDAPQLSVRIGDLTEGWEVHT